MNCLKYPLTILINKSLETGKVPSSFKLAKVIPIYKSKEKDSMNNYRPISLLPCTCLRLLRRLFIVDCILFVKCKHSKCLLFAADTTVFHSSTNLNVLIGLIIEEDLVTLSDWFCANKLSSLNTTNFLVFSPEAKIVSNEMTIKLGDQIIRRVNNAKFLGIHIDDELQWGAHIDHLSKQLASGSYPINPVKRLLPTHNLRQLYFSLIHSHLSYGLLLWGSAFEYRRKNVTKLPKRVIININNVEYNAHTSVLYK